MRSGSSALEWDSHLDEVVQPQLRSYVVIDYAKFAREAMQQWDAVQGHGSWERTIRNIHHRRSSLFDYPRLQSPYSQP